MLKHTDELRDLFSGSLERVKPHDHSVFITVDEIAEIIGEFDESSYTELAELGDEYLIEEEGGGFYVSHHP